MCVSFEQQTVHRDGQKHTLYVFYCRYVLHVNRQHRNFPLLSTTELYSLVEVNDPCVQTVKLFLKYMYFVVDEILNDKCGLCKIMLDPSFNAYFERAYIERTKYL